MANGTLHGETYDEARVRWAAQDETGRALAEARFERGQHTTDDERAALTRNSRFGADGYPIAKLKKGWLLDSPLAKGHGLFRTKGAAVAAWETIIATLIALGGLEARLHAMATRLEADRT